MSERYIKSYPAEMAYAIAHLSAKECYFKYCPTCKKMRLFHLTRCLTCKPYKEIKSRKEYEEKYAKSKR